MSIPHPRMAKNTQIAHLISVPGNVSRPVDDITDALGDMLHQPEAIQGRVTFTGFEVVCRNTQPARTTQRQLRRIAVQHGL